MPDYYICPECGTEVKVGSEGCPKCNNLDPWEIEENLTHDGLDLPDDEFDYDDFIENEFGGGSKVKTGKSLLWWIAAIVLLIALFFTWVIRF